MQYSSLLEKEQDKEEVLADQKTTVFSIDMVDASEEREGEGEKEVTEELPFDKPNIGPIVNSPSPF